MTGIPPTPSSSGAVSPRSHQKLELASFLEIDSANSTMANPSEWDSLAAPTRRQTPSTPRTPSPWRSIRSAFYENNHSTSETRKRDRFMTPSSSRSNSISSSSSGSCYSSESHNNNNNTYCEGFLKSLRAICLEEPYQPLVAVSKDALSYYSGCSIGRDFLIVEKSKFIHRGAPVSMRPGKHSFFIPSSYSLVESITRRAQEGRTNCHIFVSSEDEYAMYHGYYEIVYGELMLSKQEWGTIPSQTHLVIAQGHVKPSNYTCNTFSAHDLLRRLDTGEETVKPVFLKFKQFDQVLMGELERYMDRARHRTIEKQRRNEVERKKSNFMLNLLTRTSPPGCEPPVIEVVNVDGVDFELSPVQPSFYR